MKLTSAIIACLVCVGAVPRQTIAAEINVPADFVTIQAAIDATSNGDTILVAPGTYTGEGNRDISLFGKTITLKSTAGPEVTIIDVEGSPPDSIHRGFFLIHGETAATVIEGFTVANSYLIGDTGGTGTGGGGGGAIYIRQSSPTIRNCIIRDNVSDTLSPPWPVDGRGAGIYVDGQSSAIVENCIIANNTSARRGGGIYVGYFDSTVTIRNCVISGNSSADSYPGGGVHNAGGSTTIINTTIVNNTAMSGSGGGIHSEQSEPYLSNCILWGNQAVIGQQVYIQGSVLTIEYSDVQGGLADVAGCCGWQIQWGNGMLDADPLFVDPTLDDYHLSFDSPCIDMGDPDFVPVTGETDIDGDPRLQYCRVDMGADETPYFADCNDNSLPDACEMLNGTVEDCNQNTIPDECDISSGTSLDCNENDIPDECEGGPWPYGDLDGNGIVDIVDLVIVLDGFIGLFRFPGIIFEDIDIFPCDGGNGDINLMDVLAILDALAGFPPCPCP